VAVLEQETHVILALRIQPKACSIEMWFNTHTHGAQLANKVGSVLKIACVYAVVLHAVIYGVPKWVYRGKNCTAKNLGGVLFFSGW
jgi:hypothetical protein